MARNVFRNGASLYRVIENAPISRLKAFLLQPNINFQAINVAVEAIFAAVDEEEPLRAELMHELNKLAADQVEPVEVECRRVLDLTDSKGPTSLRTIVEQRLSSEECEEFDNQPGDLARSLWAHVHHERVFDDAVSFRTIRSWRNAGRLFAAFNVDLDGKGSRFSSEEIDADKVARAIGKKLKSNRALTISVIDLPQVPEYLPAILVIVRFAGQQSSVATHGNSGERRLLYFLPQNEAVLIYTPGDERIEVAAEKATVRIAVAECFAVEALGHDVSAKPLTSAVYVTLCFLRSVDLPLPDIAGFRVMSAEVIDLELRVENWQSRLSLRSGGGMDMSTLVERYLEPARVLRRALGVSRALITVSYEQSGEGTAKFLDLLISDGNSCSLNSERDPVIRNFGRKLLEAWGILRAFRDLDEREAIDHLPVLAELWELDQKVQKGSYFSSRRISTQALEDARLIRKKEIEPTLIAAEYDEEVQGPTMLDRSIFAIDLGWLQERLVTTLKGIMDVAEPGELLNGFTYLGTIIIDQRDVPCFLARGLDQIKTFTSVDERLRAMSAVGPGIVFTGRATGPRLIGANVIIPLVRSDSDETLIGTSRDAIVRGFRAGRGLALGAHTLELIEEPCRTAARLHVPGNGPVDVFGEHPVRAFRLLVEAAKRGAPAVRAGDLISGSGSAGFQQMMGRQWPVIKSYVEKTEPRRWKLMGY